MSRIFRVEFARGTYEHALACYEAAKTWAAKTWATETGQATHPNIHGTISRPDHPECPSACRIAPEHLLNDSQWRIYMMIEAKADDAVERLLSASLPADSTLKEIKEFVVEISPGVWLASWEGDPGRTLVEKTAKRFESIEAAKQALGEARKYRPFVHAVIRPVTEVA